MLLKRIRTVTKAATVISDESAADEVGINNTVTIYIEEDDEEETYRIVTSVREDSLHGLISNESPLGKALMGHKEGDRVCVNVNDNYSYYVVIKKIENTTEDGNDRIRSY